MWSLDPLTAGVTVAVGIGLILIAWRELSAMHNTSKAALLEQLDSRWCCPPMTIARREVATLIDTVKARHEGEPEAQREQSEAADFTRYLRGLKESEEEEEVDSYLRLIEICSFFETAGYMTRKGYAKFGDIYELFGGSILTAGILFEAHLKDERIKPPGDPKLFEHFSWLVCQTRKRYQQETKP
jgi:hypothetical protein